MGTASTPEVSTGGPVSPPTPGSSSGPCCAAKTVGNVSYTLVTEGTVPQECPLGCIYREVAGEEWEVIVMNHRDYRDGNSGDSHDDNRYKVGDARSTTRTASSASCRGTSPARALCQRIFGR